MKIHNVGTCILLDKRLKDLTNKCGIPKIPCYEIADPETDELTTLAFTNGAAWVQSLIERGPHLVSYIHILSLKFACQSILDIPTVRSDIYAPYLPTRRLNPSHTREVRPHALSPVWPPQAVQGILPLSDNSQPITDL